MKNRIPQNYFIGSALVHCIIFILLAFSLSDNKQKSFIVFGAHSKKTTKVLFTSKSSRRGSSRNKAGSKNTKSKNTKKSTKNTIKKQAKKPEKKAEKNSRKKDHKKDQKKPGQKEQEQENEKIKEKSDGDAVNLGKLGAQKKQKNKKQKEKEKRELEKKEKERREQEEREREREEEEREEEEKAERDRALEKEREEREQEKREREREKEEALEKEKLREQDDLLDHLDDDDLDKKEDEFDGQDESGNDPEEFNFLTLSDQEQALYHKKIDQEVNRLWRPPLGVPRGTKCTVVFVVADDGTIASFEMIKRSNILIYDVSIQRVALQYKFDKSLWGKKFSIDFQQ